jgi:hypothetical protein
MIDIKLRITTTAHLESHGQSKRAIQTLIHRLRTSHKEGESIARELCKYEFATNSCRCNATRATPSQITANYIQRPPDQSDNEAPLKGQKEKSSIRRKL